MAGTVFRPENAAIPGRLPGNHKSNKLLMLGAILLGLGAVQIVITWLLTPRPADAVADQNHQTRHKDKDRSAPGRRGFEQDTAEGEFTEVAVGDFSFSNTTAMRNVITHVNFKLTALARPMRATTVESQIERNQERIREAVNKIVRNANLDELYDPSLDNIKRLIREEINGLLGNRLVSEVMINDVRVIQQ